MSDLSVFYKDAAGDIFHTYSSYARGDMLLGTYHYLDLTPKGRNETGPNHNLTDWVRHHDRYGDDGFVDSTGRYVPAKGLGPIAIPELNSKLQRSKRGGNAAGARRNGEPQARRLRPRLAGPAAPADEEAFRRTGRV
jgi:hypothetical protein